LLSQPDIYLPANRPLGPKTPSVSDFFVDVGRRISHLPGEERETAFLFQRIVSARIDGERGGTTFPRSKKVSVPLPLCLVLGC
jgi:hypothetical protein